MKMTIYHLMVWDTLVAIGFTTLLSLGDTAYCGTMVCFITEGDAPNPQCWWMNFSVLAVRTVLQNSIIVPNENCNFGVGPFSGPPAICANPMFAAYHLG